MDADATVAGAMGQRLEENIPNSMALTFANYFVVFILLISEVFLARWIVSIVVDFLNLQILEPLIKDSDVAGD